MSVSVSQHPHRALGLKIAALVPFIAYAGTLIWQTSFLVDGQRTFCLFDDAMISMTYARNLVEGHGLSWSRWDSPVEGFTHPLWTLGMLLPQLSGLPLGLRPLLVQLASLTILVFNVLAVHRLAARHVCLADKRLALIPAIATAAYYPLNYWSLLGMESGLQSLLVIIGIQLVLDLANDARRRVIPLCLVLGASVLLRLDMALFAVEILVYALVTTQPWKLRKQWAWGALLCLTILGSYQVFRVWYFEDWLPNTYYLKMSGGDPRVRITRGAIVLGDFLRPILMSVSIATLGGLLTLRTRKHHALLLALVWTYFAYSVYVGGDAWEASHMSGNRFDCFVMPVMALLLTGVLDVALARHRPLHWALILGLGGVLASDLNGLCIGPDQDARLGYLLLRGRPYSVEQNERVTRDIHHIAKQLPEHTRVAVVWAGIPAYFSNFEMVDIMGYNDREIARRPWTSRIPLDKADTYLPGHMKHDLFRTLASSNPRLLFQWWCSWGKRERDVLRMLGYKQFGSVPDVAGTAGEMWLLGPESLKI